MKTTSLGIPCAICLSATSFTVQATDLVDLIPSLYDGNGITLEAGFHQAHFSDDSTDTINQLNDVIASEVRTLPIGTSSPGGIAYKFDADKGTYELIARDLGPVLARGSRTLGKGSWSVAATFTAFEYDKFNGDDIGELKTINKHQYDSIGDPNVPEAFEHDTVAIMFDTDIKVRTLSFWATYGITEKLDVNIVVPVVSVDLSVNTEATLQVSPLNPRKDAHAFGSDSERFDSVSGDATGLGDIVIGATYQLFARDRSSLAGALIIKTPTGDEDNFLGTGSTTVQPAVFGEMDLGNIWGLHGNLGYEWDSDDHDQSALQGIIGMTVGNSIVTGSLEAVGRVKNESDLPGSEKYDIAVGLKGNPGKNVLLSGVVVTPLNDDGLRADYIVSVGVELLF